METRTTRTIERNTTLDALADFDRDSHQRTQERLDVLLAANLEYARQEEIYRSDMEEFQAALIAKPLTAEKAFAYFGLLLGLFPPASIFINILSESNLRSEESWLILLIFAVVAVCSTAGYFSGKLVGKIVGELEKKSWSWMLLALPFIGLIWGIISGGAGGFLLFGIGAVFGAGFGGAVGSIALPMFSIFHRLFKRGEVIDRKIFMPLAFGVTFIISAFILGL